LTFIKKNGIIIIERKKKKRKVVLIMDSTLYDIAFWNGKDDDPVFETTISARESVRWDKKWWKDYAVYFMNWKGITADRFVAQDRYSLAIVEVDI
jgi:hypothetical protein